MVVVVGGMLFGVPFLEMIRTFFTHGLPRVWHEVVEPSACYRGIRSGTWFAIVLPIIGIVLGLGVARLHIGAGQILIYGTFVLSYIILGVLLFLADAAAAVIIAVLPETERTEIALHETRIGFKKYVQTILAFELFAALSFVVLGVYGAIFVVAAVVLGLAAYYQVSAAYDIPVTWAPGFMMGTSITAIVVMVILVALSLLPITRPYLMRVGVDPVMFLNNGVISSGNMNDAEKDSRKKEREICDAEIADIVTAIANIKKDDMEARATFETQKEALAKKKKSCTF